MLIHVATKKRVRDFFIMKARNSEELVDHGNRSL